MSAEENLPEDRREDFRKARRLAWLTIAYLLSAIALLGLVLGSSQALRTAWCDDLLSLFPPILFLVGSRVAGREPTEAYPYGFGRAVSAAYLGASLALFAVGGYLLIAAVAKLVAREHPSIGGIELFGHVVWHGWLAIPVLVWSGLPAVFLGRAKLPLAKALHDKVLFADARMNAADWQTAGAALLGVIGIGLGWWWADSAVAALIALEILRDGGGNVRAALADLMDRRPQQLEGGEHDPLPAELTDFLEAQDWVADAAVRVREQGRQFLAEAMVVPRSEDGLVARIEQLSKAACDLDWRLIHVNITPVTRIPDAVKQHTPRA
jgi:cation diffusion facilitator family transporter